MGYYTRYSISIQPDDSGNILESLLKSNESASYAMSENGESRKRCKWYEHENELRKFSKQHPKVLFVLDGEGEESGDIWVKYFQNGKCQVCKAKITFDEFDAKKLL